jgi:hypothetical protein
VPVLADHWPLLRLRLTTPLLELRPPGEEELAALADVAAGGVHPPGERPYLTPWTDLPPARRARYVLQQHAASQGVSRKLGYRPDGVSRDVLHGEVVVSDRLRLDPADWRRVPRAGVAVHGLAGCLPLFGC